VWFLQPSCSVSYGQKCLAQAHGLAETVANPHQLRLWSRTGFHSKSADQQRISPTLRGRSLLFFLICTTLWAFVSWLEIPVVVLINPLQHLDRSKQAFLEVCGSDKKSSLKSLLLASFPPHDKFLLAAPFHFRPILRCGRPLRPTRSNLICALGGLLLLQRLCGLYPENRRDSLHKQKLAPHFLVIPSYFFNKKRANQTGNTDDYSIAFPE